MTLRESQKHAQAESGRLTPCASLPHPRRAAAYSAAGIGVPNTRRIKRRPSKPGAFFMPVFRPGVARPTCSWWTVRGAARPPVLRQVRQPRIVRHPAHGVAVADSSTEGVQHHEHP